MASVYGGWVIGAFGYGVLGVSGFGLSSFGDKGGGVVGKREGLEVRVGPGEEGRSCEDIFPI